MEREDELRTGGAGGGSDAEEAPRDFGVPGRPAGGVPAGRGEASPSDARWGRGEFDEEEDDDRVTRNQRDPGAIRAEDTEPYIGLQYVARLFKVVAMVVIVALTAEIVAALAMEGPDALFPLFLEVLQGAVLAALLWGASDLTLLFIDVGHDVRAARVLLGRMSARMGPESGGRGQPRLPRDGERPGRDFG